MPHSQDARTHLAFAIVYIAMIALLFLEDGTDPIPVDAHVHADSTAHVPAAMLTPTMAPSVRAAAFRPANRPRPRP